MMALWLAGWVASLALTAWLARRRPRRTPAASSGLVVAGDSNRPSTPEPRPEPEIAAAAPDVPVSELLEALDFHRDCQSKLARSIVDQLRSTTEPLTQDLVGIRTQISDVVGQVREHDHRIHSREDLDWVKNQGIRVSQDMAEVARLTQESDQAFERHFQTLRQSLETILEISQEIEDLSQRINVLSINASIEAARAGAAGRGFKVIAGAVKALALETSTFLTQIEATVDRSRTLFAGIGGDLEGRRTRVADILRQQNTSFDQFRSHFVEQRDQFEALYRTILDFTDNLDGQVSRISPVVQLHDITVQELENLAFVNDEALTELQALIQIPGAPGRDQRPEAWGRRVRKRLTTASELAALDAVLRARGVDTTAETAPAAGTLELF